MISFSYQHRFFFLFRKRYFYLSSSLYQNNADIYHVVLSSFSIKNKMLAKHQKYVLFFFYGDTFWRHCLIYHSQNSWFLKGYSCILYFSSFFFIPWQNCGIKWGKNGKQRKTKKKNYIEEILCWWFVNNIIKKVVHDFKSKLPYPQCCNIDQSCYFKVLFFPRFLL